MALDWRYESHSTRYFQSISDSLEYVVFKEHLNSLQHAQQSTESLFCVCVYIFYTFISFDPYNAVGASQIMEYEQIIKSSTLHSSISLLNVVHSHCNIHWQSYTFTHLNFSRYDCLFSGNFHFIRFMICISFHHFCDFNVHLFIMKK